MRTTFSRYFAPTGSSFAALLETLLLPSLAVALGLWVEPADPFFIRNGFPWSWLAPLLLALRYGPMVGLASSGVLFLLWFGLIGAAGHSHDLPKLYFLGGLTTVMLAAEFSSVWGSRLRRSEAMQRHLLERLDGLTRNHYLLRLSHDRLEQELLARPVSMRDALTALRELVGSQPAEGLLPAAEQFLRLGAQYCQIDQAALIPLRDGALLAEATVFLGAPFPIDINDPLIGHARRESVLVHIAIEAATERERSQYIIAVPINDVAGRTHALLVVNALPFFALQDETLQMLNLMVGYYGDSLTGVALVAPITARWPACPPAFALELQRLIRLHAQAKVPSMMVALTFTQAEHQTDLPVAIQRQQRALDVSWLVQRPSGTAQALLVVMPLANADAVDGYLARIARWLETNRGLSFDLAGIRSNSWQIGDQAAEQFLAQVLEHSHGAV